MLPSLRTKSRAMVSACCVAMAASSGPPPFRAAHHRNCDFIRLSMMTLKRSPARDSIAPTTGSYRAAMARAALRAVALSSGSPVSLYPRA